MLAAGVEIDAGFAARGADAQGLAAADPCVSVLGLALASCRSRTGTRSRPLGAAPALVAGRRRYRRGFAQAQLRIDERILHYLTGVRPRRASAGRRCSTHGALSQRLTADGHRARAARRLLACAGARCHASRGGSGAPRRRARRGRRRCHTSRPSHAVGRAARVRPRTRRELADWPRAVRSRGKLCSAASCCARMPRRRADGRRVRRSIAAAGRPVIVARRADADAARRPRAIARRCGSALRGSGRLSSARPGARRRAATRALSSSTSSRRVLEQALASIDARATRPDERCCGRAARRGPRRTGRPGAAHREPRRLAAISSCRRRDRASCARSRASCEHRLTVYERLGIRRARQPRGLGISALFAGESGTGKTLAAEVIRQRARSRSVSHRSRQRRQQVHRRDGKESVAGVRRRRSTAARSCCSTRPTRSSASAAR